MSEIIGTGIFCLFVLYIMWTLANRALSLFRYDRDLSGKYINMAEKSRYFNFVVYPDSCPDWFQRLKETHLPFAWILHDKDSHVNECGEEVKKPHIHVLIQYGNATTLKHMRENVLGDIPANGYVRCTHSPRGMYRYLIHEDDPNKHQYEEKERHLENGFSEFDLLSNSDTDYLIWWIDGFARRNDINDYDDLLQKLDDEGLRTEYTVVTRHTMHYSAMMKSRRCKAAAEEKKRQDEIMQQIKESKQSERQEFNKSAYQDIVKRKEFNKSCKK